MEPSSRRSSEAALSSDSLEEEEVLMFKKGASYKQDSTKEKPGKGCKIKFGLFFLQCFNGLAGVFN